MWAQLLADPPTEPGFYKHTTLLWCWKHCIDNTRMSTKRHNICAFKSSKKHKQGGKKGTKLQVPFASWLPIKSATKAVAKPNKLLLQFPTERMD